MNYIKNTVDITRIRMPNDDITNLSMHFIQNDNYTIWQYLFEYLSQDFVITFDDCMANHDKINDICFGLCGDNKLFEQ